MTHETVVDEIYANAAPFTLKEAIECVLRFNHSHWRDTEKEHARYSIPADPQRDDDIRLIAHLKRMDAAFSAAAKKHRREMLVEVIGKLEGTDGLAEAAPFLRSAYAEVFKSE